MAYPFLASMATITNLWWLSFQLFLVIAAEMFSTQYSKAAVTNWLNMALKMLTQMEKKDNVGRDKNEISIEHGNQTS